MNAAARHFPVLGASWISGARWATLRHDPAPFEPSTGAPVCPGPGELGCKPPSRWGRFDAFARLGFAAVALALRDAQDAPDATGALAEPAAAEAGQAGGPTGLILASATETAVTDEAFYATALDERGALASPQLFSYTLPTTLIGECAIAFGLRGPALTVGNRPGARGLDALRLALEWLTAGTAARMICLWGESAAGPGDLTPGAVCAVIGAPAGQSGPDELWLRETPEGLCDSHGRALTSLEDCFAPCAGR